MLDSVFRRLNGSHLLSLGKKTEGLEYIIIHDPFVLFILFVILVSGSCVYFDHSLLRDIFNVKTSDLLCYTYIPNNT